MTNLDINMRHIEINKEWLAKQPFTITDNNKQTFCVEPIFKVGDKVKIVNYGSRIYQQKYGLWYKLDLRREIVGKTDVIRNVLVTQGRSNYALEKYGAWFVDEQLEKR